MKWLVATFVALLLIGLGLVAGGASSLAHKESGVKTSVKVSDCEPEDGGGQYPTYDCTATWVAGGSLIGGKGHVVYGEIDDASPSDVGKTIEARVSGGHAYTLSLAIPIILLAIGGLITLGALALGVGMVRGARRRRAAPA